MEQCRACLSINKKVIPIDDNFLNNYNILTNLDVKLSDDMSHVICETCLETVNYFITFRNKCILSESSLRIVSQVKCELLQGNDNEVIGKNNDDEVKAELESDYDECKDDLPNYTDIEPNYSVDMNIDQVSISISDNKEFKYEKKKHKKKKKVKKEIIPSNGILYCGVCPIEFVDKQELSDHLENHKLDRECKICSKIFKDWPLLVTHRIVHVPKNQINCHICQKRFVTHASLEYHYRRVHYKEEFKPTCHICDQTFNTPLKLRKHEAHVHSDKIYICDHCSKVCHNRQNLVSHLRRHLDSMAYLCDQCEFSCKYPSNLTAHKLRRHTSERSDCKICEKIFKNEQERDKHSCQKPLGKVCPICGKHLKRKHGFSTHLKIHNTEHLYKCTRCPKKFKGKEALKTHINRHDDNRPQQCDICLAKFFTTNVLVKHRRTHTGERPFACHICSKAFNAKHALKIHMRVHGEFLVGRKTLPENV